MISPIKLFTGFLLILIAVVPSYAAIKVMVDHNSNDLAISAFKFKNTPVPSQGDAAKTAQFTLVDGSRDRNGGDLDKLHDDKLPTGEDRPGDNYFFAANTDGGRISIDLGRPINVKQVNTYSWHPNSRGPQVYKLYATTGSANDFNAKPARTVDPVSCGWTLLASVDTRPESGQGGGQYGVSVVNTDGNLGSYRYLLFDIARTSASDPFANTFYSEIDVIDADAPAVTPIPDPMAGQANSLITLKLQEGKYQVIIDTTETPDLTKWAKNELAPVVEEWYLKLVDMLPSEGYQAPQRVDIYFSASMQGVAATGGSRVQCAAAWFRNNLNGEAKGAVVHELVHVVQQYGLARRMNRQATRTPGWVVEGIPDYIRWFLYEPETRGAEITSRSLSRANYDGSYRISGNFINWVTNTHDKNIVRKLNAAAREGRYADTIWKDCTGRDLDQLNTEWKAYLEKKIADEAAEAARRNTLTEEEKKAGWQLLFNGQNLDGWHNFKSDKIRPGWKVINGILTCADPHDAGDLCTADEFDWFELQIDYNISKGGNSGIMYHVSNEGGAAWASGPEFQLEDNSAAADPVRCGWLYALYQPPLDPKTNKTLDATKPAGQWNHIRLLISPEKCVHEINGVKYFEYVLDSDDFKQRVAKSKFSRMPLFAKKHLGAIALQGDHGQVSFCNIKIRPIKADN